MSTQESTPASMDMDKRMDLCRTVWTTSYARILTHARATKELISYERCHTAVSVNKGISFGLTPLVFAGAYAHIYKTKPTDLGKHKMAMAGTLALAVATNICALYMSSQYIPAMKHRLMEKYVYTLDDATLLNYTKGTRFPNAK